VNPLQPGQKAWKDILYINSYKVETSRLVASPKRKMCGMMPREIGRDCALGMSPFSQLPLSAGHIYKTLTRQCVV